MWIAHQRSGYFGLSVAVKGQAPQFLHKGLVDIHAATHATDRLLGFYTDCRPLPGAPFAGGTWDTWPAAAVDVWKICQYEEEAVKALLQSERESPRGSTS